MSQLACCLGDHVSDVILGAAETTVSWYFVDSMDVLSPEKNDAIVCFGDSITDGYGCTVNRYERWTDELAQLLPAGGCHKAFVGSEQRNWRKCDLWRQWKARKDRFDNDVLQEGRRKISDYIGGGVNDIGYSSDIGLADSIIAGIQNNDRPKAHAAGIRSTVVRSFHLKDIVIIP